MIFYNEVRYSESRSGIFQHLKDEGDQTFGSLHVLRVISYLNNKECFFVSYSVSEVTAPDDKQDEQGDP